MDAKAVAILAASTVVLLTSAALLHSRAGRSGVGPELPPRLAPELADRVNDVAAIELTRGEASVRLDRSDDGLWRVAQKDGYPARFEAVKGLLVGLAELTPREAKTANPDRYDRLGLGEPGPGSEALGVRLLGAGGGAVASLVLGDEPAAGGPTPMRFARVEGGGRAYLVEGRIDAPTDPMRWIDSTLTQIPRDRVNRVRIEHPDGEALTISRAEPGGEFALETPPPAGRVASAPSRLGGPAGALVSLRFDDVRAAFPESAGEPTVTTIETADGLRLVVTSRQGDEGVVWASLSAEAAQADAEGTGGEEPDRPEGAPHADAPARAAELNATFDGWAFALPAFQAESLRRRLEDLTEPDETTEGAEEEDEAPGAPLLDARDE